MAKYYSSTAQGSSAIFGTLINGSWTNLMGDLTRNVADFAIVYVGHRLEVNAAADYTFPWHMTSFSMYVPYPQEEVTVAVWSFVKPFSPLVWLALFLSFLSISTVMWRFQKHPKPLHDQHQTRTQTVNLPYQDVCLYLLAVLSTQGGNLNGKGKALSFMALTWCLACIVFVNAYNGLLISYLTTNTPKPIVSSLSELISKPNVRFYNYYNSWAEFSFKAALTGMEKTMGDRIRADPSVGANTLDECMKKVETDKAVCFLETKLGDTMAKKRWDQTNRCLVTSVDRGFLQYNPCFLTRKNSTFFRDINKGIIWANAMGLSKLWTQQYEVRNRPCRLDVAKAPVSKKLRLTHLAGPFLLLLMGISSGFLTFLVEIVLFRLQKRSAGCPNGVRYRKRRSF